jgi:hypothetical protein
VSLRATPERKETPSASEESDAVGKRIYMSPAVNGGCFQHIKIFKLPCVELFSQTLPSPIFFTGRGDTVNTW